MKINWQRGQIDISWTNSAAASRRGGHGVHAAPTLVCGADSVEAIAALRFFNRDVLCPHVNPIPLRKLDKKSLIGIRIGLSIYCKGRAGGAWPVDTRPPLIGGAGPPSLPIFWRAGPHMSDTMGLPLIYAARRLDDGRWELLGPDDDPRRPSWQRFAVLRCAGDTQHAAPLPRVPAITKAQRSCACSLRRVV